MAKGQLRGNREAKKPKKDKQAPALNTPATSVATQPKTNVSNSAPKKK